jgi:uncharacterized membrane protein
MLNSDSHSTALRYSDDERGSILLVTLALAILVLYLSLLVVDLRRAEYAANGIQRAADAAALAGLTELVASSDSDADKWKNAERAALAVLKQNEIFLAGDVPDASQPDTHIGSTDACDTDPFSNYRWQIYDNSKMRIEIARGNYDEASDTFTSSENSTVCNDGTSPNSVQVTITVRNFPTVFGAVLSSDLAKMAPIVRTGKAAQL